VLQIKREGERYRQGCIKKRELYLEVRLTIFVVKPEDYDYNLFLNGESNTSALNV
jgi:hypothetical protein